MKYRLQYIALLFYVLGAVFSQHSYALADSMNEPILVLIERDPWRFVIGSDSPSFVLYDNGRVIFTQEMSDKKKEYRYADLSQQQMQALLAELALGENIVAVKEFYDVERMIDTDQVTQKFYVNIHGKYKAFSVYGSLREDEIRQNVPQAITALFDAISDYSSPQSQPWLPEKIEVMVWPYDNAIEASIIWPKHWPDLAAPDTKKRHEDQYSIYIDSQHLQDVRQFLMTRAPKGAVEINGKKWAASIRYPFPQETRWMESDK